ncbi:hypothetical protein B4U84_02645 [Westiellopsis prolifica IICB1]|nr:hypothetical protein B4U84_02645 [Westiellopsis prolifica IICB1]
MSIYPYLLYENFIIFSNLFLFYLNSTLLGNFGFWILDFGLIPQSPIPDPQSPTPIFTKILVEFAFLGIL